MTKTSVLINTYNHSAYIAECVESVFAQTVAPDEIIVYDDGSVDDTVRQLRVYGSRITLIEGRHGSPPSPQAAQAAAVHAAFGRSTGDLVFFLDGDDRFKPNKIERYLEAWAANPDASLIHSVMDRIDQNGRYIGTTCDPLKVVADHLREIYRQNDVDFYHPMSSLAIPRPHLQRQLPLDYSDGLRISIDTRLSVVAPHFGPVVTLAESCTEWRRHPGSRSIVTRSRRLQLRMTVMRARVFNDFCRRNGLPAISLWRNRRFWLQIVRFLAPQFVFNVYYDQVRPRFASKARKAVADEKLVIRG
jgi:glycosyltransferase involved in cell wall biosynthesis